MSKNLGKQFDYFKGSRFGDDKGNTFSVEAVIAHAQSNPKYLKTLPIKKVAHDRSHWQGDESRMQSADTSHPLLVVKDKGHLSVADGLNRLEKLSRQGATHVKAYVVPKKDIEHLRDE